MSFYQSLASVKVSLNLEKELRLCVFLRPAQLCEATATCLKTTAFAPKKRDLERNELGVRHFKRGAYTFNYLVYHWSGNKDERESSGNLTELKFENCTCAQSCLVLECNVPSDK